MAGGIDKELMDFAVSVVTGVTIRTAYGCVSAAFSGLKNKNAAENLSDFFFWIAAAVYMFRQVYMTSHGIIRWFFILGIVSGVLLGGFLLKRVRQVIEYFFKINRKK